MDGALTLSLCGEWNESAGVAGYTIFLFLIRFLLAANSIEKITPWDLFRLLHEFRRYKNLLVLLFPHNSHFFHE